IELGQQALAQCLGRDAGAVGDKESGAFHRVFRRCQPTPVPPAASGSTMGAESKNYKVGPVWTDLRSFFSFLLQRQRGLFFRYHAACRVRALYHENNRGALS